MLDLFLTQEKKALLDQIVLVLRLLHIRDFAPDFMWMVEGRGSSFKRAAY